MQLLFTLLINTKEDICMKLLSLILVLIQFTYGTLSAQSNMTIQSGGATTVNGDLIICTSFSSVGVTIVASANPVCAGTSVTFTATPVYGGTLPVYQWRVNGNSAGPNNPAFSYLPVTGDVVTCIMTSNAHCITGNPATSNPVTMTVNPLIASPASGTHTASQTQIVWNWNGVMGATGYKWNTTDDWATAIDLGIATSKTEPGLLCGTAYTRYVWAYNSGCNSPGIQLIQSTTACPPYCGTPVTDARDGKIYNTVMIGTQCWMSQNMNIGTIMDNNYDQTNNGIVDKYCYDQNESNCTVYGGLYQWGEVVQYYNGASNTTLWNPAPTGNVQGICPAGWHVPTNAEYTTLVTFLGGESVAGGKMKEAGNLHWRSPNTGATNSSGFSGLPGGNGYCCVGSYIYLGYWANFYTATQVDYNHVYERDLYYQDQTVHSDIYWGSRGRSVRCVKD
jgi:uncharacterized protein (TIGR02145 family)